MKTKISIKRSWIFKFLSIVLIVSLILTDLPNPVASLISDINVQTEAAQDSPYIIEEVTQARGKYSKTFLQSNNEFISIVTTDAIHFDDRGEWKDIDNTLEIVIDAKENTKYYINKQNSLKVKLPEELSSNKEIELVYGRHRLLFGIEDIPTKAVAKVDEPKEILLIEKQEKTTRDYAKLEQKSSGLEYRDVYPDTDIRYRVESESLKEEIILKRKPKSPVMYRYTLQTDGLDAVLNEDGSVTVYEGEMENVIFFLPAPFMYDNEQIYETNIKVNLISTSKSEYVLEYIPDYEWLTEEARQYPVVIDPVIKTAQQTSNGEGSYVSSSYPSSNFSTYQTVSHGHESMFGTIRAYLRFNTLPELLGGGIITSSKLNLFQTNSTSQVPVLGIQKVTSTWSPSTITWSNKPGYESNTLDYIEKDTTGARWQDFDITNITRDWYNGISNYGLTFLEIPGIQTSQYRAFAKSNYSVTDKRPYIEVTYKNATGLESYYSYHSQDMGKAGTAYINDYTGNLSIIREDIGIPGNRLPVSPGMVYNLHGTNPLTVYGGSSWTINYAQTIEKLYPGTDDERYRYTDKDGTKHYLNLTENNTIEDEDGLGLSLIEHVTPYPDGIRYELKSSDITKYFNADEKLIRITENSNPNDSIEIEYKSIIINSNNVNVIDTITDGAERVYKFEYTTTATPRLDRIDYYGLGSTVIESVEYVYDTSFRLVSVQYPTQETIYYSYHPVMNMAIISINDSNGTKAVYEYTGYLVLKVSKVSLYGDDSTTLVNGTPGDFMTVTYDHYQSTFTNSRGKKETVQFNSSGNPVSTYDENWNVAYAKYTDSAESNNLKNKLISTTGVSNTSINMIKNYSLELDGTGYTGTVIDGAQLATGYPKYGTTEQKYLGDKSLGVSLTSDTGRYRVSQSVVASFGPYSFNKLFPTGKTYEFSVWVKTQYSGIPDEGAWLEIEYKENSQIIDTVESNRIKETADWQRLSVQYTIPEYTAVTNQSLRFSVYTGNSGTVWFDNFQTHEIKTGFGDNLIDNGDFIYGEYNWTKVNCYIPSDYVMWLSDFNGLLHPNLFKLNGEPEKFKHMYQTIPVSGNKGDPFTLSAWGKANPVPFVLTETPQETDREMSIRVEFTPIESQSIPIIRIPFNEYTSKWQSISESIHAPYDYSAIKVSLVYANQLNTAYFDGIQLYKSHYGTKYGYDEDGKLIHITDGSGDVVEIEYDESGTPISFKDSYGRQALIDPDEFGRVKNSISSEGVIQSFEYDEYGNVISQSTTDGRVSIPTTYEYTTDGNYLEKVTDPMGNSSQLGNYTYYGAVQNVTDAKGTQTDYGYDSKKRLESVSQIASGLENTYNYDTKGYLGSIGQNGFSYNLTYDKFGALDEIKVGTTSLVEYDYNTIDKSWNLESVIYGNNQSINYQYNQNDMVTDISFGAVNKFKYVYDSLSNLLSSKDLVNNTESKYYYDSSGSIINATTESTDARGYYHSFATDNSPDGTTTHILESIRNNAAGAIKNYNTSYIRDLDGRNNGMWYETEIGSQTIKFAQEIRYDAFGRIESDNVLKTNLTTQGDAQQLLWKYYHYRDNPNYKTTGQIHSVSTVVGQGPDRFELIEYFEYDENGFIVRKEEVKSSGSTRTIEGIDYVYDKAGQLTRYNDQKNDRTWVYVYDAGGNIVTKKEYNYTTGTPGSEIKTYNYVYDSTWKDKLVSYDEKEIDSDAIGNIISIEDGWNFTWEAGRQLAQMSKGADTLSFSYNDNGLRTSKTVNSDTTYFTWGGDKITREHGDDHSIYYRYDGDGALIGFELEAAQGSGEYFYIRNLQGDITGIVDINNQLVVEYSYDAWGKLLSTTGTLASTIGQINPFRYRGYYYDNETGLYYLQSRYYNPEIGRFINADVAEILFATQGEILGANLFAYCSNNPVMFSDPSGYISVQISRLGLHYRLEINITKRDISRYKLYLDIKKQIDNFAIAVTSAIIFASGTTLTFGVGTLGAGSLSAVVAALMIALSGIKYSTANYLVEGITNINIMLFIRARKFGWINYITFYSRPQIKISRS